MGIDEAFAAGVDPDAFFTEHLPVLFARHADGFGRLSDVDVTVGVRLEGQGGGQWTLVFTEDALDAEAGAFGRPLFSFHGDATRWDAMRPHLAELARLADAVRERDDGRPVPDKYRLTDARLGRLERLVDGAFELVLEGVPGVAGAIEAKIVLNSFEDNAARRLRVVAQWQDLLDGAHGRLDLKQLVSQGRLKVSGDTGLTVKLASAYL